MTRFQFRDLVFRRSGGLYSMDILAEHLSILTDCLRAEGEDGASQLMGARPIDQDADEPGTATEETAVMNDARALTAALSRFSTPAHAFDESRIRVTEAISLARLQDDAGELSYRATGSGSGPVALPEFPVRSIAAPRGAPTAGARGGQIRRH